MKLIDELQLCIEALEVLKNHYLAESKKESKERPWVSDIHMGQYIAYASCYSVLIELLEKYRNV